MNAFIRAVEQVEAGSPRLKPVALLRELRKAAGHHDAFTQHFLGDHGTASDAPAMDAALSRFLGRALRHRVPRDGKEEGVVLTSDGTTVALSPLLLGIEAGLQSKTAGKVPGLYHLTLARNLGLSFQHAHSSLLSPRLGPNGCWDNSSSPKVFTLSDKPSLATDALINGGMDGLLLGTALSTPSSRPAKLSSFLRGYYCRPLGQGGLDAAPRLISPRRRVNLAELVVPPLLSRQVMKSIMLQRRLKGQTKMEVREKKELKALVRDGVKEFVDAYMDCPAIIPRCAWEAKPYRGTPTPLSLPLSNMYIHHTYTPSSPCLSFQQCSEDMRAMQRFHQDDRGWDDIGYSFVAGSDGYIYEGRGWQWQGAHTKGYNSKGYGVSFIGDYSSSLPSQRAMELVRDRLASCAVGGGRLVSNFSLYGHRQLVDTTCPGDALYSEIKGWEHYRVRE
ncbi:peptidoglycan recognition protein 6 [Aplochiton taeniatus]